jgi:curved DNA-binding protein CbpA
MNTAKDYYSILGVLPSIEASALDAVYKALVKKYHPDVFAGDKNIAEEKTKEINEAYSVLRDPQKRKQYDEQRQKENKGFGSFEQNNNFDNDNSVIFEQIKKDWEIVIDFYPSADFWRKELEELSPSLAILYQITLITEKMYEKFNEIGKIFKIEFLKAYFGDNDIIQKLAVELIKSKNLNAAIHLNNVIRVIGSPNSYKNAIDIEEKIRKKFNIPLYNHKGIVLNSINIKHAQKEFTQPFYNTEFDFSKLKK